tara:strand:- start:503 stop:718 length:216 start_codon:yes stop_codon:yes gene_type:complete
MGTQVLGGFAMEVGKTYNVVFATGRYEIEYENGVTCIKVTPQSYRVERADGSTRLVKQDLIMSLEEIVAPA